MKRLMMAGALANAAVALNAEALARAAAGEDLVRDAGRSIAAHRRRRAQAVTSNAIEPPKPQAKPSRQVRRAEERRRAKQAT